MPDDSTPPQGGAGTAGAEALAKEVASLLAAHNVLDADVAMRGLALLAALEHATPGGAPLHHQIDVVRRWIGVLRDEPEHARYGGTEHLRDYLVVQLRLLRAAVADYLRQPPSP